MKRLVIFGTGQIGQVAHYYFSKDSDYTVAGFTVDADYLTEDTVQGLPVFPFETLDEHLSPDDADIFIAMGYGGLNQQRRAKLAGARAKGYRAARYVSTKASVWDGFEARDNLFLLENNVVQPGVTIGENTTLWSGNHIGHHATIGANVFIASHAVVSGAVTIGDNCFIGVNATIADNLAIGDDCVVGAGALILADAPDKSVYSGTASEKSKVPSNRLRGL